MRQFKGGDDDKKDSPVSPDPNTPGPEAGEYAHPDKLPGDEGVDNSQLG